MEFANYYCETLRIAVPRLEEVKPCRDAKWSSLLIAALLERGAPMTLREVARRLEEAGFAEADAAHRSLVRCKPARAPVYRDGDLYALDPHDDEADFWAFRLELRPPRATRLRVLPPPHPGLPTEDDPVTLDVLREAWAEGTCGPMSTWGIAVCVLEAHGGVMTPDAFFTFVEDKASRYGQESLRRPWRSNAPVRVREDGRWELVPGHASIRTARRKLSEQLAAARRLRAQGQDAATQSAIRRQLGRKRAKNAEALLRLSRAIAHAFPLRAPRALVVVDVQTRDLHFFEGDDIEQGRTLLADYDIVAALEVRRLMRVLRLDPHARRLGELGPPQKTRTLDRYGRTLKITPSLIVTGSCGIPRPLGDEASLSRALAEGRQTRLRRRLETDARSLFWLYHYGRLQGSIRLRWGSLDERLPAHWRHPDEPKLTDLMDEGARVGCALDVVTRRAPDWDDPWSRAQPAFVEGGPERWQRFLVDRFGQPMREEEVQIARLATERGWPGLGFPRSPRRGE